MDTDQFFEPLSGISTLVGANQKDCPDPFPQRYMRPVKNRIYRNRGLMPTVFALKNLTPFHEIGFSMTTRNAVRQIGVT